MSIKAGLVGLPNVGKSSLFNALTNSSVPAENYPFCTIDPHVAITQVPDERIAHLMKLYASKKEIPAQMSFVDIAGLVKGAAAGQGLGNQFLSNIREVDLIIHVLRCFEDENVNRQEGAINPVDDFDTISGELMLKDIEATQKRLEKIAQALKGNKASTSERKAYEKEQSYLQSMMQALDSTDLQRVHQIYQEAIDAEVTSIPLLSTKPYIVVANVAESDLEDLQANKHYQDVCHTFGTNKVLPICIKTEYELARLDQEEAQEMMEMLGITSPALPQVIRSSFENLGLITFFTCGPQEIHAWPITKGLNIRQSAGKIHSDLERGFICAEIFNYQDLKQAGTIKNLKETGKVRTEGQDYITQDGDIVLVRFNV